MQLPLPHLGRVVRNDQHPERAGVHESHLREVDDQLRSIVEQSQGASPESPTGQGVQLAVDLQHRRPRSGIAHRQNQGIVERVGRGVGWRDGGVTHIQRIPGQLPLNLRPARHPPVRPQQDAKDAAHQHNTTQRNATPLPISPSDASLVASEASGVPVDTGDRCDAGTTTDWFAERPHGILCR
jgi:hypothetical protein